MMDTIMDPEVSADFVLLLDSHTHSLATFCV